MQDFVKLYSMRKFLVILLLTTYFLLPVPVPVSAHLAGQPPYLRINGAYTNLYPVPVSSASNFNLPQDFAQGNFLVGKEISFVMETDKLPAPPEVVKKTNFSWDFGDGSPKVSGFQQNHTYQKMGSFVQVIYADDGSTPYPQLLSSVLINVLPDPGYKLPEPKIFVNGLSPKDPLIDPLKFNLTQNLAFDGSKSQAGTGKITSYTWDMGDGTTKDSAVFNFQYTTQINQAFPVLRLRDENGFIADAFIEVETGNPAENNAVVGVTTKSLKNPDFLTSASKVFLAVAGIGFVILMILKFAKRRKTRVKNN